MGLPPSWKAEIEEAVEKKADAAGERQNAEAQKSSSLIAEQIKTFVDAYNTQSNKPERKDKLKRFLDVSTVILLLFTALFTGLAWLVFKGQLNEMQAEQRPWIGIKGLGFNQRSPKPGVGNVYSIGAGWANSGKAPAFHAKSTFYAKFSVITDPPEIPPKSCADCGDGDVMLPDVPLFRSPNIEGNEFTPDTETDFISKKRVIWLTGRTDYLDGSGKPHKTFICYQFFFTTDFISCNIPDSNYAD